MKIKNRLYLGVGTSVILVIILASVVFITSDQITKMNKRHKLIIDLEIAISELDIVMYEYLLRHETRMEQQWNSKYDSTTEILEKAEEELIELIRADYVALGDLFSQVTENYEKRQKLIQEGASQEEIDTSLLLEERLVTHLLIKSQSIIANASRLSEKSHTELMEAQELAKNLTLILMLILAITVTFTSLFVARSISKPLTKLTKGAEIIGKGNLKHRIDVKSKDETGILAQAFNKMVGNLSKEINERKKAEKTIKRQVEELKTLDKAKDAFFNIVAHELLTPMISIQGYSELLGELPAAEAAGV